MMDLMNMAALFVGWAVIGCGVMWLLAWPLMILGNIVSQFVMWRLLYAKADKKHLKQGVNKTWAALTEAWDERMHRVTGRRSSYKVSGPWGWVEYRHPLGWTVRAKKEGEA